MFAKFSKKVNQYRWTSPKTSPLKMTTQQKPKPQAAPSFIPTEYEAEHMADDSLPAMPDLRY